MMRKNEPIVQIKNLSKKINNKTIIDDLSFELFPGEVYGFLGPNGAGKTTTIRMMVGLMEATKGQVFIKGQSIQKDFKNAIAEVGGIVENPEMYKFLSGYKNLVHYSRMVKGVSKERIDQVVQLVGLENRIHEKVKNYSLGMRQRLGLAQALLHSPSLLILDEPTNGLDPSGIHEIRNYLRKIAHEDGVSVLVSSHLLSEMEMMCDRIAIIQNGKLIDVQTVDDFVGRDLQVKGRFTVVPVDKAKTILETAYQDKKIEVKEDIIALDIEKEDVPAVVSLLVKNDIRIYSVQANAMTLEEKFLEVTGGNQIV
ncbi:ABC transporter ATP-binding protein [Pseudalkalibacillus caeni]|uniref:ABC transporter ATP-binding protein n=1 Tax=Exobacillus caeni TaxID=2574798 RepID=A0A5R9F0U7_9BACL|nr:ABC transporter ATP-binding protein [Pseudalkalibacillus caeni]TLS35058.1 ABC transporter ATP-binding protein [Pseudalkalibacillus caeni]